MSQSISFDYYFKYAGDDEFRFRRGVCAEASDEEFLQVLAFVKNGTEMDALEPQMPRLFSEVRENAVTCDRFYDRNGYLLKKPLKKSRELFDLHFRLSERDAERMTAMKDPETVLKRARETMKIYRKDGSFLTLTTNADKVSISDSREKYTIELDADDVIDRILWR